MITQSEFNSLLEDNDKILTQEEEYKVFEFYNKNKTVENKNKIALKNIRLIYKPSWEYVKFGSEKEDLQQEAFMAILHAVDKFDHTREIKFSTYAYNWIESYLQKCTIDDQLIHIPFNVVWKIEKMKKLIAEYEDKYNKQPPDVYLKNVMGIDYSELNLLRQYETRLGTLSMDYEYYNEEEPTTFHNYVIDENQNIDKLINQMSCSDIVNTCVRKVLSKEEYDLLSRRYGFNGNKAHSLTELSNIYKVSEHNMNMKIKKIQWRLRGNKNLKEQIKEIF